MHRRRPAAPGLVAAVVGALLAPAGAVPAGGALDGLAIELGRDLFEDRRLSATGTVACASCHEPARAFTDGLPVSEGVRGITGTRNAPSLFDVGTRRHLFWDGRVPSLEEQALRPFVHPSEMGLVDHEQLLAVLRADSTYVARFAAAFAGAPDAGDEPTVATGPGAITLERVARALAVYQGTLRSPETRFDRFLAAEEGAELEAAERRGWELFRGAAGCAACHLAEGSRPSFTDDAFHAVGVGEEVRRLALSRSAPGALRDRALGEGVERSVLSDPYVAALGRHLVTGDTADLGAFRTPSLREVAATAPYMHDGSMPTLRWVLENYDRVARRHVPLAPLRDGADGGVERLLRAAEVEDLLAFLRSITATTVPLPAGDASGPDRAPGRFPPKLQ